MKKDEFDLAMKQICDMKEDVKALKKQDEYLSNLDDRIIRHSADFCRLQIEWNKWKEENEKKNVNNYFMDEPSGTEKKIVLFVIAFLLLAILSQLFVI